MKKAQAVRPSASQLDDLSSSSTRCQRFFLLDFFPFRTFDSLHSSHLCCSWFFKSTLDNLFHRLQTKTMQPTTTFRKNNNKRPLNLTRCQSVISLGCISSECHLFYFASSSGQFFNQDVLKCKTYLTTPLNKFAVKLKSNYCLTVFTVHNVFMEISRYHPAEENQR